MTVESSDTGVASRLVGAVRRNAQSTSAFIVLQRMGYRRVRARHLSRLAAVVGDDLLGLDQPSFDFHYTSEGFARKLCEVLEIDRGTSERGITALRDCVTNRRAYVPYLFVDTDFRRASQPIFVLAAMEGQRHLTFARDFRDLSWNAQIEMAGQRARQHYAQTKGALAIWGDIKRYHFYQARGRIVVLNNYGAFIKICGSIPKSHATLSHDTRRIGASVIGAVGEVRP